MLFLLFFSLFFAGSGLLACFYGPVWRYWAAKKCRVAKFFSKKYNFLIADIQRNEKYFEFFFFGL